MITALDTNVLLDVFLADRRHGAASRQVLARCIAEGGLVACEVVWTEVATFFADPAEAQAALEHLGVRFVPMDPPAALEAARRWAAHRGRDAEGPHRVAADFLIGAHALLHADRLLSRDQGFYRKAFKGLTVLAPES
ncbi:MAG: PIN domain-containing protein [Longimicrobiales bacterium]|nr:PIN domain-containing protein [Longimicrobiales bacterium]